uniref:Uncharacterized protein n=1 Tax=Picea glauca TaxID=3330 RepID=A0A101M3C3_PICGL|nr:hypothetical protein ABT39_MTgene3355 [Picea glauca]
MQCLMMIISMNNAIWIPKYTRNAHGKKLWFGMDKKNTYMQGFSIGISLRSRPYTFLPNLVSTR